MNETLLMLVLAYVFLLAILILFLLNSQIKIWAKYSLVMLAVVFYFVNYQGWQQSQGWPASVTVPDKFLLHYAVVDEPDKKNQQQGHIYLWLTDLANDQPAEKPRSYRIDYTQTAHVEVNKALKKIKGGNLQLGVKLTKKQQSKEQAKKAKSLASQAFAIEFVDLPDPALPEK